MKTKKINKKLALNRMSIAQLDNDKINQVKGGQYAEPSLLASCHGIACTVVSE